MTKIKLPMTGAVVLAMTQAASAGSVPDGFVFAAGGDAGGPHRSIRGVEVFYKNTAPLFLQPDSLRRQARAPGPRQMEPHCPKRITS
jgi:hypothetical protein